MLGFFNWSTLVGTAGESRRLFQNRNTFNVGGKNIVCINDIADHFSMSCYGVMFDRKRYFAHRTNHFLSVVVGIYRVVGMVEHKHNETVVSVFGGSPERLVL